MALATSSPVVADPSIPDGRMDGLNADGELIVQIQYMPDYKRILGDEADERRVVRWVMSPQGKRRVASIAAWNATGNMTAGSA